MIQTTLKKYEIEGEFKHIHILEDILEIENNQVVSYKPNHRRVINPGDDVSNELQELQDIVAVVHTAELITAYNNSLENNL